MRHVTLTLSDDLAAFATEAAAEQGYPTLDAYLDALLREAREVGLLRSKIEEGRRGPFEQGESYLAALGARRSANG